MAGPNEREQAIRTLSERLRGFGVAMLTTVEPDGALRSRPMINHQPEFEGDLWFLARGQSRLVWSIQRYARVNLTYVDSSQNRFVSVTGTAHVVRDLEKAHELWHPSYKGWLESPDNPDLCLVKVTVDSAQAWGGPAGGTERIEGFAAQA
jgi:general stress protein 26